MRIDPLVRVLTLTVACVVVSACATAPRVAAPGTSSPLAATAAAPTPEAGDLSSLQCSAKVPPTSAGQITFVTGSRLYTVVPDGSAPHCLADDVGPGALQWGPRADRVVVGGRDSI